MLTLIRLVLRLLAVVTVHLRLLLTVTEGLGFIELVVKLSYRITGLSHDILKMQLVDYPL